LGKKDKKKGTPPSSYNTMPYYFPTEQVDIVNKRARRARSIGLSPVWAIMSNFSDSSLCAAAMSVDIFSLVGGCMLTGSRV